MDLLTPGTRDAISAAARAAKSLGAEATQPAHLLIGVLSCTSAASRVLAGFGLTATKVVSYLSSPSARPVPAATTLPLSDTVKHTILTAHTQAQQAGTGVDPVRLTRVLLGARDQTIEQLLTASGTSSQAVLAAFDALDPASASQTRSDADLDPVGASLHGHVVTQGPALAQVLTTFGVDLVASARAGKLSPVYGRDRELDRVQVILSRRTKNNPVLVGEAGVGKTAVVEALAQAIAAGTCSALLRDRPLIALDVAAMVAGTKARGEFEDRLKKVVAAARAANAILFIDEIHQIVGAGGSSGAMGAANLLKEHLARGQLTLVGATTLDEYRKHIEADAALERRLDKVLLEAPSVEDTVAILRTLRPTFAAHHGVRYSDDALQAAATLTDRHVSDRQLPDKAIDALDEAGAAAAMAIARSTADVRGLYTARRQAWITLEKAVADERYEDAAPLAAQERELTAKIVAAGGCDLGVLNQTAVAAVVAAHAGVPVGSVICTENDFLLTLDDTLKARVVGQDAAVDTVVSVVRRRRVLGAERPTALLFAGPTGVGKTELATALADSGAGKLLRFDMSEYAEKHTVSRLVGAPPGYAGYDDGGQLTEAVRRNPHAVVLLDEVEKAHPDVFDLLLQVLEDGRLTDSTGKAVSFKDTIVILTSNLGSAAASAAPVGFASSAAADTAQLARRRVMDAVKGHFRPELLNRLDHVVVFNALTRQDLTGIVANLLDRPLAQLAERGVRVRLTDAAIDALLAAGYDPAMGARPLRRAITRMLENPVSDAILAGALPAGSTALVDAVPGNGELIVVCEPQLTAETALVGAATTV